MHADKNGADSTGRRHIPRAAKTARCIRVNRRASAVEILRPECSAPPIGDASPSEAAIRDFTIERLLAYERKLPRTGHLMIELDHIPIPKDRLRVLPKDERVLLLLGYV